MDTRFSPEQRALRDSAAQVVDHLGPKSVAQLDDGERAAKLDAAIAAAGWRELRADAGAGEPWASAVEAAIVAEELGRGLADAPYIGPTLAAELRRYAGVPATPRTETVVLDGSLRGLASDDGIAIDAAGSTSALVAQGDRVGVVTLAVERTLVDLTRPSVSVPAGVKVQQLGAVDGLGTHAVTRWTALGLALTCADLVGVMRGALDLTCEYAKSRRQYGAAIGSFQAIQHLLADALVAMEGSRSITLRAAWGVDALAPEDALAAGSVAKAYCSRAARMVCETAIQVHGGIGNTWDCLAHVYLRRASLSIDVLGGVGANLARVLGHHGIGAARGLR
jgi:alkylation response protein AidB-like acyl-CoA dehydrogenase